MNNQNQPAFPGDRAGQNGMTMRQYYKAAALQGMLANQAITEHQAFSMQSLCSAAAHYADEMLYQDAAHAAHAAKPTAGGKEGI